MPAIVSAHPLELAIGPKRRCATALSASSRAQAGSNGGAAADLARTALARTALARTAARRLTVSCCPGRAAEGDRSHDVILDLRYFQTELSHVRYTLTCTVNRVP
eukprot:COSAG06_NODE_1162_length_10456_cov_56.520614_10_plen_105_part_00